MATFRDSHKGFDFIVKRTFPNKYIGKKVTIFWQGVEVGSRSNAEGILLRNNLNMDLTAAAAEVLKDHWHKWL